MNLLPAATEETMNDAPLVVCFRFLAVDDLLVPQLDISIPVKHLEALPESLLSKRCEWNAAEQTLANPSQQPILVHPSNDPYKQDWCHDMGKLIVDAYAFLFNKKEREGAGSGTVPSLLKLKLPAGMELEAALMVLDYYGLSIENPRSEVSLENSNDLIQIRAQLFLVQMELLHNIKDFVVETLKKTPRRIIHFVHMYPNVDNIEVIQKTNMHHTFIQLGNEASFRDFKEVLEEESMRRNLVALLGDVGLKAKFVEGCDLLYKYIPNHDIPNIVLLPFFNSADLTSTGKCRLVTSKVIHSSDPRAFGIVSTMEMYGCKYELEERHVLQVEVSKSWSG